MYFSYVSVELMLCDSLNNINATSNCSYAKILYIVTIFSLKCNIISDKVKGN